MKFFKDKLESAVTLALITAIIGGSNPIAAKIALEAFHPFTLLTIRFLFATLFLLPFIWKHHEFRLQSIRTFFLIGVLGGLNPIFLFVALQFTLASVSPLIYAAVPAMTTIYLYIIDKEKLSTRQVLGILVGLIGVSIIVLLPLFEKHIAMSALQGNILIFFAAVAFMFYGIKSKSSQTKLNSSPIALVFYFSLISLIICIPFMVYEIATAGIPQNISPIHLGMSLYTGIVGTGVFYLIYQTALKNNSTVTASLYTYLQPISTILLAMLFLNEKITPTFIIGGLLAVVGARLALVSKADL